MPGFYERREAMPYKNQETRREYMRQYQRERRAGTGNSKTPGKTLTPEDIRTAKGLLAALTDTISEVDRAKGDVFIKARLKGYLISIGLKAVEVANLEGRITELEAAIEQGRGELN